MQQTNQPDALNLVGLLSEGLPYVDQWTPTLINSGGCGIFARLLSEELTKHGIEHKIFALFYGEPDSYKNNLKTFLKTGKIINKDDTGVNHISLLVNKVLYVDSTGIINGEVARATDKIEMSLQQLDVLNEKGGWNSTFDRECVPFIADHIREIFLHLDDFHVGIFKYPKDNEVNLTQNTLREMRENSLGSLMGRIVRM